MQTASTTHPSRCPSLNAFVGRQPIFDSKLRTIGYELLYRSDDVGTAVFQDGTKATSAVLANLLTEFGLDRVVGTLPAWVNFPETYLLKEMPIPVPPNGLVLEVLEDVHPTPEIIGILRRLVDQDYRLALDDFEYRPELRPFLELARYVKVDVRGCDEAQLARMTQHFGQFDVELLAEKVETMPDFERCRRVGFQWFQGFFMSRPDVLRQRRLPANRAAMIRLLGELHSDAADVRRIESLVAQDVALSYRVLRCLNSALYALPNHVESVQHALVMLGQGRLRNLVSLLVLGGIPDKPSELVTSALIRARTSELLARATAGLNPDSGFTVGLFSMLDALLDVPMQEVLEQVPLASELAGAILEREGAYGRLLGGVEAQERGDFAGVVKSGIDRNTLLSAWLEALAWVRSVGRLLEEGPSGGKRRATGDSNPTLRPGRPRRPHRRSHMLR